MRFKRPKEVIADIAQAGAQQGHPIGRNALNAYIELSLCRKNDFRNFECVQKILEVIIGGPSRHGPHQIIFQGGAPFSAICFFVFAQKVENGKFCQFWAF